MACMQSPSVTKSRGRRYSRTVFLLTARTACLAQRFGGENGGMTVAVHYASFVCYPCGNVGCEPCVATPRKSSPSLCVLFRRSSKRAAACCAAHDIAPWATYSAKHFSWSRHLLDPQTCLTEQVQHHAVWFGTFLPGWRDALSSVRHVLKVRRPAMPLLLCRSLIRLTRETVL